MERKIVKANEKVKKPSKGKFVGLKNEMGKNPEMMRSLQEVLKKHVNLDQIKIKEIEFEIREDIFRGRWDDEPWSGNIYRYSF